MGIEDAGSIALSAPPVWAVNFPDRAAAWKEQWPVEVAAAMCARQSVRAIELNYAFVEAMDPVRQEAACEILSCVGVRIMTMHSPFSEPCALEHPERSKRLAAVDRMARCLRFCGPRKICRLVVHPCNRTCSDARLIRDNLCRSIEELLPVARQSGVVLCLENMPPYHPFGSKPEEVGGIIEQFGDPYLRVVFDVGHANMTRDAAGVFDGLRPFIAHTHLHDNSGDRDLHLPPGYGTAPWPELMPRLLGLGLEIPLFIEASPWHDATDFARLQLETTALANACLGNGRFPTLRQPGPGDDWKIQRDPMTGRMVVYEERAG